MYRYFNSQLRSLSIAAVLGLAVLGVQAQSNSVKGIIADPQGNPVPYANVLLLSAVDSALEKASVSDSAGKYFFDNIKTGKYQLSVSFAGMQQDSPRFVEINSANRVIDLGILYLKNAQGQLKDVVVSARKPMYEQKFDRTIINVRNSITSAGGNALDVLEKSPGVIVNRQSRSISINGKSGVSVMINGKISYMPTDALIQLLSSISAGNIERIELISTPPSKYDASGNGGYINIVFINNPFAGFSGSYFITAGYGQNPLGGVGFNFNYRTSKLNLYGNYSFNHDHYLQPSTGFIRLVKDGNTYTTSSFSDRDAIQQVQNFRVGADYQASPTTIIGVLLTGSVSHWSMISNNSATISKNNQVDTTISTVDDEINHWHNFMSNLNVQHTFKPGEVLYFDANYIYYEDDNPNTYLNTFYNREKELLFRQNSQSGKLTPFNFRVFSSDYTRPLGKKMNLEAGLKYSLSRFTNKVSAATMEQGNWVQDSSAMAQYELKENIGAAYASLVFNPTISVSIKAGLRYEYTMSNLVKSGAGNIVDKNYGEFFPTIYISKKLNDKNSLSFSYSRRITRPAFTDLAPFTIFFDPKTFYSGNPALQPAIANTVQAGYVFKNYSASFSYTYESNSIENFYFLVQRVDTVSNTAYLSPTNYKYEQYLNASLSLPVTISPWWSMQNNITAVWRQINASFDDKPVRVENVSFNINSTQRFSLFKGFALELSGLYSSSGYFGTAKREPMYQFDAGLQKKFSGSNDVLRFTANDVFNSGAYASLTQELPVAEAMVKRTFNFGLVAYKLTFTHNFGNKALQGKRERSTGAEAELERVHH